MKTKKIIWISLAFLIVGLVFNGLCFWLVNEKTSGFYISIAFGNFGLVMYALSSLLMSKRSKYIYLSVQNAFIIGSYSVLSLILNFCFAMCKMNNDTANIITNGVILAIYLVFLFSIFAANADSISQSEEHRRQVNKHYDIKQYAEQLLNKGHSISINKKLETIYDNVSSMQIYNSDEVGEECSVLVQSIQELQEMLSGETEDAFIYKQISKIQGQIDTINGIIKNSLRRRQ